MMKHLFVALAAIMVLAGCSKKTQYSQDLTGTWTVYKLTYNGIEKDQLLNDSFSHYTIAFTGSGQYMEQNVLNGDTVYNAGTWQFQNSYGQLVLTDTAKSTATYTIFNLTSNHVELLRNSYDRYMRKNQ